MKVLKLMLSHWALVYEETVCKECGRKMPLQDSGIMKVNPKTEKEYSAREYFYVCQNDECPNYLVRVYPTPVDA